VTLRSSPANGRLAADPVDDATRVDASLRVDVMDIEERRNLQALEAIAQNDALTQRTLARRLGIALGLTNTYLKRLIRKGYVKCINVRPNRLRYLLTPKGLAEKSRLTYEFMQCSLLLYGQVRQHLHAVLEPYAAGRGARVAVYGTGEAAELAYLSITEFGLELVAVLDASSGGRFLGRPVRHINEHREVPFDILIVATLQKAGPIIAQLAALGVPPDRVVALRR
jgi:DNA-binding MarR family transcriptional regulator